MQLDRTGIVIRERRTFEVLELAICVLRAHAKPLCGLFLIGVLPMMALNYWMLSGNPRLLTADEWRPWFTWWTLCLVIAEIPLVTAPATLYLGQVLFLEKPGLKKIARDLLASAWQLVLLQGVPLVVLLLVLKSHDQSMVTIFCFTVIPLVLFRAGFRPYLNEIILLERNPLRSKGKMNISTRRRSKSFHSWNSGDLFARSLTSGFLGAVMVVQFVVAMILTTVWITGSSGLDQTSYMLFIQSSIWITACFFCVVRFLSYLDLRIRREGWEIELRMRAEAARLSKELI